MSQATILGPWLPDSPSDYFKVGGEGRSTTNDSNGRDPGRGRLAAGDRWSRWEDEPH